MPLINWWLCSDTSEREKNKQRWPYLKVKFILRQCQCEDWDVYSFPGLISEGKVEDKAGFSEDPVSNQHLGKTYLPRTSKNWEWRGSYGRGAITKTIYQPYHETNHPKKFSAHHTKDLKFVKTLSWPRLTEMAPWASVWCASLVPDPMCSIHSEWYFLSNSQLCGWSWRAFQFIYYLDFCFQCKGFAEPIRTLIIQPILQWDRHKYQIRW